MNVEAYSRSYDLLYLTENLLLLAVLGSASVRAQKGWRRVYWNLFLASSLYTLGSESMNAAITRGQYYSGSLYDIPFLASISWFLRATLVRGRPGRILNLCLRPNAGCSVSLRDWRWSQCYRYQ